MKFINDAKTIEKGKFAELFSTIEFKPECLKCSLFDVDLFIKDRYECDDVPSCIGATLNPSLIQYLRFKTGLISKEVYDSLFY